MQLLEHLRCLKALHSEELAETWNRAVKESKTTDNAETENLLKRLQHKEARFQKYQNDQHTLNKDPDYVSTECFYFLSPTPCVALVGSLQNACCCYGHFAHNLVRLPFSEERV